MLGGALRWLLHSPGRLSAAVVVAVGAVIVLGWTLGDSTPRGPDTGPRAVAAHGRPEAAKVHPRTLGPGPPDRPVRLSDDASIVAANFLRMWLAASATEPESWADTITHLATPQLAAGLRVTDPSRVPSAELAGPLVPLVVGSYAAEVRAGLSDGSSVVLQLVYTGDGWRVSDIRPGSSP
jgi:hypothetical protein